MRALLTLAVCLLGVQLQASPLEIHGDSGIEGPAYQAIVDEMITIHEANPKRTQIVNIGQTVRGRDTIGIMLLGEGNIQKTITITGATHGNEYLGIVHKLIPELLNPKNIEFVDYFNAGGSIFVLPILNPDGYEKDRRHNANGKDVNRDFPLEPKGLKGLKQPESRNIVDYVEQWMTVTGSTLEIAMDYHCCYGGLLYPFAYAKKYMPDNDLGEHIRMADMMLSLFPKYTHGITGEVLGYYPKGTSKDYWYLQYGTRSYTFEGKYREEQYKLGRHVQWWRNMVGGL